MSWMKLQSVLDKRRFLSPYRCVVTLGIVLLSLCLLNLREGMWIWENPWKNWRIMTSTSWDEQNSLIFRADSSIRERTQDGLNHIEHKATLINKVVGERCPIFPPTVWALNELFTQLRPHSRTDLSLSKSLTWPKLLLTNPPGSQLAPGSQQNGLTSSLWLSDIFNIFRFSSSAVLKGRKRTTSWEHWTSSSSSYYFSDCSVNWEQLLLPFKTTTTPQKNADTSQVLPLDQTWAATLHSRRKSSIWTALPYLRAVSYLRHNHVQSQRWNPVLS